MTIYTSYFYMVRFFKPNTIALSTAMWDPRWFHKGNGQRFVFKDARGVYNGLRAEPFVPGTGYTGLCAGKDGHGTICDGNPETCKFLQAYYSQLNGLDPTEIAERFIDLGNRIGEKEGFSGENCEYVLLVHEAPTNLCSEREVIRRWLHENKFKTGEYTR